MFDHVAIRVSDREASERFYDTVLPALGIAKGRSGESLAAWQDFRVVPVANGRPVTRGLHIGFAAPSHAAADEFWRVGTEAGYRDDGPPGPRPAYGDDYYGAFLLDPDGNSAEGARHDSLRSGGIVDHLWIRVADVARSKAFYEELAPYAGFRLKTDTPERAQFSDGNGSFSVVAGDHVTENLHMAFPASGDSPPDMALVDPDGNTIELVPTAAAEAAGQL